MDACTNLETLDKEPKTSLTLFKAALSSVQGREFAFAGRAQAVSEKSLFLVQACLHGFRKPSPLDKQASTQGCLHHQHHHK